MPKRKYSKKPNEHLKVAKSRINELFKQAKGIFDADPRLSDRYVTLARRLSMKYKVPLTSAQKRIFCKHCYHFLMPGKNLRVRTRVGKLVYYCENCKKYWRKPINLKGDIVKTKAPK